MTTHIEKPEAETHKTLKHRTGALIHDVGGEISHEASRIRATGAPSDPTQTDHVVRKHVFGLSVGFFVAIVIFLLLVIAGIAFYQQEEHSTTPAHGMMRSMALPTA